MIDERDGSRCRGRSRTHTRQPTSFCWQSYAADFAAAASKAAAMADFCRTGEQSDGEGSQPQQQWAEYYRKIDFEPTIKKVMDVLSTLSFNLCNPILNLTPQNEISEEDIIMGYCGQQKPCLFKDILSERKLSRCVKLGEGTYGEVYGVDRRKRSIAVKIIPVDGEELVNGETQKCFRELLPEVVASSELHKLRSEVVGKTRFACSTFVELYDVHVVKDRYPDQLLRVWDDYARGGTSENDRPDYFPDSQLFLVFEFGNAGRDLAHFPLRSVGQAKSILRQVLYSLLVAESELLFEHRDLHWGNVLVRDTSEKFIIFHVDGERLEVASEGVKVTIIDFTNSRLTKDGLTVYMDLSKDEELFQGEGDDQFEVYRMMRKAVEGEWGVFLSYTNVLWLDYLATKLTGPQMKYSNSSSNARRHRSEMRLFRESCQGLHDNYDTLREIHEHHAELGRPGNPT